MIYIIPVLRKMSGKTGNLPDSRAAFPFMRIFDTLEVFVLHWSLSSSPLSRDKAEASFLTSLRAYSSQPPYDLNTDGMKDIPSAPHS